MRDQFARQTKRQIKATHPGAGFGQPGGPNGQAIKRFKRMQPDGRAAALAQGQHDALAAARAAAEVAADQQHQLLYTRPMMDAVAISSSSRANDTAPETLYGSSSGFSEYLSKIEWLILLRLTLPMVQPPKRLSAISS